MQKQRTTLKIFFFRNGTSNFEKIIIKIIIVNLKTKYKKMALEEFYILFSERLV